MNSVFLRSTSHSSAVFMKKLLQSILRTTLRFLPNDKLRKKVSFLAKDNNHRYHLYSIYFLFLKCAFIYFTYDSHKFYTMKKKWNKTFSSEWTQTQFIQNKNSTKSNLTFVWFWINTNKWIVRIHALNDRTFNFDIL